MSDPRWDRAATAAALLGADPAGLGGLWLRARASDVRSRYIDALMRALPGLRKLGPTVEDSALDGTLDVTASLSTGRRIETSGLLSSTDPILVTSAERMQPGRAARLAAWLDRGGCLILLDEGDADDEAPPEVLLDRLALFVDLEGMRHADSDDIPLRPAGPAPRPADTDLVAVTKLATGLGISGLRAPILAIRAAIASAAINHHETLRTADMECAAEMVLGHRAAPPVEDTQEAPPPPPPDSDDDPSDRKDGDITDLTEERLIDAVETALSANLLAELAARRTRAARSGSGAGAMTRSRLRGRPLPSRRGPLDGRARLDLIATLRAAAPWQNMRSRIGDQIAIRTDDIHVKRYAEQSARLVIFVVDASGSAAMTRMAEAKGAVGLLLGEAYRSRDSVALIGFRGETADLLLPPTRALVAAKKRLSALPGGGATPLADALRLADGLAEAARRGGTTPLVVLMTDGRANRALDGSLDRAQAGEDALAMAARLRSGGTETLVLDTGNRRSPALRDISARLDATCLPLPRGGPADVARLVDSVGR